MAEPSTDETLEVWWGMCLRTATVSVPPSKLRSRLINQSERAVVGTCSITKTPVCPWSRYKTTSLRSTGNCRFGTLTFCLLFLLFPLFKDFCQFRIIELASLSPGHLVGVLPAVALRHLTHKQTLTKFIFWFSQLLLQCEQRPFII